MSQDDSIAVLIPWYANGTLEAAEREQVASHLAGCPGCYALLARARAFRRQAPGTTDRSLFDHVEGHLLVQFAEQPDRLEPDARRFISTHLGECGICADAMEVVQDLSLAPIDSGEDERAFPAARGLRAALIDAAIALWRGLSRTMLQPVPALIYLGALLVVLTAVPLHRIANEAGGGPGDTAPVAVTALPPAIPMPEETIMRGEEQSPVPQTIVLPAGQDPLVVELVTSIDFSDLADTDAEFRIDILAGERIVHSLASQGSDFDRRGRLSLVLDPRALTAGERYTLLVRYEKEGDIRDGETLYRRSFLLQRSE